MRKKLKHNILAEGEHTGHKHVAEGGVLYQEDEALILKHEADQVTITHEEHNRFAIPPSPTGEYQVGGVVEVDPFSQMERRVAD